MRKEKKPLPVSKAHPKAQRREISAKKTDKKRMRSEKRLLSAENQENVTILDEGNDIVGGKIAVLSLLNGKRSVNKLFCQEGLHSDRLSAILSLSKQKGIDVHYVPKSKLDSLTNHGNHQGMVAMAAAYDYATLDDVFALADRKNEPAFVVVLDGIEDPHNLGSILRTAAATGVHGVVIPKRRAVGLTAIVAKTAAGALEHVPVVRVTNVSQTIQELKERGCWVYATAMTGQAYTEWAVEGPIAVVIGNEGKGVSRLVQQHSDGLLTIPMAPEMQSLNASVAAGILMYEVYRNRH